MQTAILDAVQRLPSMQSLGMRDLAGAGSMMPTDRFHLFRHIAEDLLALWRTGSPKARRRVLETVASFQDLGFSRHTTTRVGSCLPEYARLSASVVEDEILLEEVRNAEAKLEGQTIPDADAYGSWFHRLIASHTAAHHPFYVTYLRKQADLKAYRFLLAQESTLDPRFDDIIAMLQIGAARDAKLEYARNYWDEMGAGNPDEVHSSLFSRSLSAAGLEDGVREEAVCYEAKLTGVISSALALKSDWYSEAMGYFGVTEYLVPRRMKSFCEGWKRLGLPEDGAEYQRLHIRIDALHAAGWINNVIVPAVRERPEAGRAVAIGALVRLESSKRYLDQLTNMLQQDAGLEEGMVQS